jgi:hypothetical protein
MQSKQQDAIEKTLNDLGLKAQESLIQNWSQQDLQEETNFKLLVCLLAKYDYHKNITLETLKNLHAFIKMSDLGLLVKANAIHVETFKQKTQPKFQEAIQKIIQKLDANDFTDFRELELLSNFSSIQIMKPEEDDFDETTHHENKDYFCVSEELSKQSFEKQEKANNIQQRIMLYKFMMLFVYCYKHYPELCQKILDELKGETTITDCERLIKDSTIELIQAIKASSFQEKQAKALATQYNALVAQHDDNATLYVIETLYIMIKESFENHLTKYFTKTGHNGDGCYSTYNTKYGSTMVEILSNSVKSNYWLYYCNKAQVKIDLAKIAAWAEKEQAEVLDATAQMSAMSAAFDEDKASQVVSQDQETTLSIKPLQAVEKPILQVQPADITKEEVKAAVKESQALVVFGPTLPTAVEAEKSPTPEVAYKKFCHLIFTSADKTLYQGMINSFFISNLMKNHRALKSFAKQNKIRPKVLQNCLKQYKANSMQQMITKQKMIKEDSNLSRI